MMGFTLIELSIVLVIIGLITGGLLVGQDLIAAAQMRKVASQYQEYNTAAITFRLKYNCLAGDCKNAATLGLGTSGDGDKQIDYDGGDTPLETVYAWQHLSNAGLVGGSYSGTAIRTCATNHNCYVLGSNVPKGPLDGSMITFFYIQPGLEAYFPIVNKHIMVMSSIDDNLPPTTWQGRWHNPVMTAKQLHGLDAKLDDGKPFTGNIVDIKNTNYTPGCTVSDTLTTTDYVLTNDNKLCLLMWKAEF